MPIATLRGVQLAVRAAAAAGLAVAVAQYLQLPFPIYAMIAAVIVSDLSPAETRRLGMPRIAGTVVGAGVGLALTPVLPPHAGTMALGVLAAMLLAHIVRLPEAAKVSGYVSGIILLDYDANPWVYAQYRLVETALGIATAIMVSLVPKLFGETAASAR